MQAHAQELLSELVEQSCGVDAGIFARIFRRLEPTSVRLRPFRPPGGHKKNDRVLERGLSRGERLRAWIFCVCSVQRFQVSVAGPIARASGRPGFFPDIANVCERF